MTCFVVRPFSAAAARGFMICRVSRTREDRITFPPQYSQMSDYADVCFEYGDIRPVTIGRALGRVFTMVLYNARAGHVAYHWVARQPERASALSQKMSRLFSCVLPRVRCCSEARTAPFVRCRTGQIVIGCGA